MSLSFNTATRGSAMIRNANRSGTAPTVRESEKAAQKAPEVREGSVQDHSTDRDVIRAPSAPRIEVRDGRLYVTFGP
jgi:hypothetical protein